MVKGKVIRFDAVRGYGFVAPDDGGEDVFIHVNDLDVDKHLISTGAIIEFDIEEGDRGPKASRARLVERGASERPVGGGYAGGDEGDCDILTAKEYRDEVTEALLTAAPTMTAEQIVRVRQRLIQLAGNHGWVEN
ncbi:cold shock domain-containing protein [Streptomyces durbertensis]|uniref:Cold shock domain-containing protein n=1 Tax=Streptomyces durbertensis TaxID=2448886 RepID=A0ABR6EIH3_9ACTN|nr:cold shock domain-containing protein [Streptomyces durbertensis]MBB1245126.1 cold shock domain-containing protein [Streptomyces durbertensis]